MTGTDLGMGTYIFFGGSVGAECVNMVVLLENIGYSEVNGQ